MLKQRGLALTVCVLTLAFSGSPQSAGTRCLASYARADYAAALPICEAQYSFTRHPQTGIAAARAAYRLGRHDDVLRWRERLSGTAEEATAWMLAAAVHSGRQEQQPAKRAYLSALQLFRAASDSKKAADCLYRLFYLSWQASEHRDAFVFATQAFEEASRAHDRPQEVSALEGLFAALYEIGDLGSATQVLAQLDSLVSAQDRAVRARLALHRGAVLLSERRAAPARSSFEEAISLAGADSKGFLVGVHLDLVEAALLLGDLPLAEQHLSSARQHTIAAPSDRNRKAALAFFQSWIDFERGRFREATDVVREVLDQEVIPDWRWQLQFRLGRAEEARGRGNAAERAFQEAVDGIEGLRAAVGIDEFKDWLIDQRRQPFEALFRLNVGRGNYTGALRVVEQAKARAFLDAFVQNASSSETSRAAPQPWSIDLAADRLNALQRLMPAPGESTVTPLPPIPQLLREIGERHVLAYFQAGDQLWSVVIARGAVTAQLIGQAAEIRRLAERFSARPDDVELAADLGRLLLPESRLPAVGSALYIVPDRALGTLPFAALRRDRRWIAEDWTVSYLPSVSALTALSSVPEGPSGPAVVIGDPGGDLSEARKEAKWVASHLGVEAQTGHNATHRALSQASGSRLLHIAAHTWLAPGGPWLGLTDERVSASTVLRDHIRPQVAVLASCSGAVSRGGGYWGSWGAAFLAAGTPSVVASLWSVGDAHSRQFVLRFYAEGGAGSAAEALARAQRAFIKEGRPPSFWAPFVHMGLRRPLAR